MRLDRDGAEFIHFPFASDAVLTTAEVYLDGAWQPASIEGTDVVVFCAGPTAPAPLEDDPVPVVLPVGVHVARVRFRDQPEAIVRGGGYVIVE